MDKIKNLSANKGGTELYKPLIDIYENKIFIDYKMKKNIILLTDGELSDKEKVINLIGSNAKNFLFNSIGIGNCDKDLIERTALMGNGYSCYINNLNTLNTNVISLLEKTQNLLCVECISNQKPSIEDQNIKPIQINDYFTHGFILDEINMKDIEFSIKPNEKDIIKISFDKNNITKLPDGDKLGKLIVDNYLKSGECKDKNIRIKLSKEYNILISETAFFAEMTNDVAIQDKMIKKTNKNKKALNNIEEAKPKSQNNKADDEEINDEFDFRINLFGNNIYLNDDDESIERNFVKYREERLYFGLSYDIERPPQKENWFKSIYKKIINKIGIIKRKIYKYKQKKIPKKEYYYCADKCACPNDFNDKFSLDNLDLPNFKENVNEYKISFNFDSPKKEKEEKEKKEENEKNKKEEVFKFEEFILGQDIIDGNWTKDTQSDLLIKQEKDLYEKIKKVAEEKGITDENGIITLFALYYIYNKKSEKVVELKFVINKAKNYIKKKFNIEYDDISKMLVI